MNVTCAWCRAKLGDKHPSDPGLSHGICVPCADRLGKELEQLRSRIRPVIPTGRSDDTPTPPPRGPGGDRSSDKSKAA